MDRRYMGDAMDWTRVVDALHSAPAREAIKLLELNRRDMDQGISVATPDGDDLSPMTPAEIEEGILMHDEAVKLLHARVEHLEKVLAVGQPRHERRAARTKAQRNARKRVRRAK